MPIFCSAIYEQGTENRNQEPNKTRLPTAQKAG